MTKILIVEDEEAISDLIKMSLTKAGISLMNRRWTDWKRQIVSRIIIMI